MPLPRGGGGGGERRRRGGGEQTRVSDRKGHTRQRLSICTWWSNPLETRRDLVLSSPPCSTRRAPRIKTRQHRRRVREQQHAQSCRHGYTHTDTHVRTHTHTHTHKHTHTQTHTHTEHLYTTSTISMNSCLSCKGQLILLLLPVPRSIIMCLFLCSRATRPGAVIQTKRQRVSHSTTRREAVPDPPHEWGKRT